MIKTLRYLLESKRKCTILLIVIATGVFLLLSRELATPMIAEADAYSRTNIAVFHAQDNYFFNYYGGTWLPIHFTIFSVLIKLFGNPHFVIRLVTLLLSMATSIALFSYTENFYSNKIIPFLTFLFFLHLPIQLLLSTQTLSEPIFLFFFVSGLALFTKKKATLIQLLLAVFLINISSGIRYESWIAMPLMWYYLYSIKMDLRKKILIAALLLAFPILWICLNAIYNTGPLSFFQEKYAIAQRSQPIHYFNILASSTSWLEKLYFALPFPFVIVGLYQLQSTIKKYNYRTNFLHFLPLFLFFSLVAQAYLGTMEWFPLRYLLIPIALYIPLIAASLYELSTKLYKKLNSKGSFFLLLFVSFLLYTLYIYPQNYEKQAQHLRNELFFPIKNSSENQVAMYKDFSELVFVCENICTQSVIFVYNTENLIRFEEQFIYFLNKEVYALAWDESFTNRDLATIKGSSLPVIIGGKKNNLKETDTITYVVDNSLLGNESTKNMLVLYNGTLFSILRKASY